MPSSVVAFDIVQRRKEKAKVSKVNREADIDAETEDARENESFMRQNATWDRGSEKPKKEKKLREELVNSFPARIGISRTF